VNPLSLRPCRRQLPLWPRWGKRGSQGKGRGFAPYPPILSSRPSVSHSVIPTERSERRDPQERTRKQRQPLIRRSAEPSDTFPPKGGGRQGGAVPFPAGAMPRKGLRPLPPNYNASTLASPVSCCPLSVVLRLKGGNVPAGDKGGSPHFPIINSPQFFIFHF